MTRSWFLMALFACGTTPKREEPAPAPSAPPPADAAIIADAAVVATAPCVLHTDAWRDQPAALAVGGKPFVDMLEVAHAKVDLATATATLQTRAITVTGEIKDLRLHAAAPFVLGNYAAPGAKVPMMLVSSTGDQATVELVVPFTKAKVRGARACSDLALDDAAEFDPRDAIGVETASTAYVHDKRPVPLAIEYGKPAVVTLRFVDSPRADILEKRGTHARVAIYSDSLNPAEHVMFVGWVPQSALHTNAHGFGGSWATGGNRSPGRERPVAGAKLVTCAKEIALDVELEGARHTVGTIAANAIIEVLPDDSVRIRDSGAELLKGARWAVAKTALAVCVTRP
jgi:hypothetical protein